MFKFNISLSYRLIIWLKSRHLKLMVKISTGCKSGWKKQQQQKMWLEVEPILSIHHHHTSRATPADDFECPYWIACFRSLLWYNTFVMGKSILSHFSSIFIWSHNAHFLKCNNTNYQLTVLRASTHLFNYVLQFLNLYRSIKINWLGFWNPFTPGILCNLYLDICIWSDQLAVELIGDQINAEPPPEVAQRTWKTRVT